MLEPPVIPGLHYVRPLGSGGFADLLLYEQDFPRRSVAVKVMHAQISDPVHAQLFQREADALARVSNHPSVLTIHSASITANGRPYLVLEYCPGSIGASFRTNPLPVDEVLSVGVRIGSALETVHKHGMLHRDIKPSNLLVNAFGTPVLADFGIASSVGIGEEEYAAMSIPWSAPEVITGETPGTVQSEVWALAATLYGLLTGRSPFEVAGRGANSDEQLSKRIQQARYTPIGGLPPILEDVLAGAMSKDPANRPQSALEFIQQLRGVQQSMGLPITDLQLTNEAPSPLAATPLAPTLPVRSYVPVESKRRSAQSNTTAGTPGLARTTASSNPSKAGKGRLIALLVSVAVVTAVVTVAVVMWMGA